MKRDAILCIVLVAAAIGAYAPVLNNGFVNFDDDDYITLNPHVRGGLTAENAVWAFTSGEKSNWHPLTWISHMLDVRLFGLNAGLHHLMSVLLHAGAAVLLFLALRRMTAAAWPSVFVAGVFALHPAHVESVAWAAERKDVLAAFFWMATLLAYAGYVKQPTRRRFAWVIVMFVLGILSKPMVVTLPPVLLLLDFWPLNRMKLPEALSGDKTAPPALGGEAVTLRALVIEKAPLLAIAAVSCVITMLVQREAMTTTEIIPLQARILNALISYVAYLGVFFWPDNLSIFYPYRHILPASQWMTAGVVIVLITAYVLRWRRSMPYLLIGWLWYLGTLVPVIGLVQVGGQAMADRYTYLPFIGLAIMLAWSAREAALRWSNVMPIAAVVGIATLAACAAATVVQVGYWRDNDTLFRHALAVNPENEVAHTNLGMSLIKEAAEEKAPDVAVRKRTEAIGHFREALRILPRYFPAGENLAAALLDQGSYAEAEAVCRNTLENKPELLNIRRTLALTLAKQGRLDEAVAVLKDLEQRAPDAPSVHASLAEVRILQKNYNEAIMEYQFAISLQPENPEWHSALGNFLFTLGRWNEAMIVYKVAIDLKSTDIGTFNNAAWRMATHPNPAGRDSASAVALAEEACRLMGRDESGTLDTLAAAYADAGRFADAVAAARKAEQLAVAAGLKDLAADIHKRLLLYQAGKPYREPAPGSEPAPRAAPAAKKSTR